MISAQVRDYAFLDILHGHPPRRRAVFSIRVLGIDVWTCFCNLYEPRPRARSFGERSFGDRPRE